MNRNKKKSKNGREFFKLLEDLDEDIVEDAWEEKGGRITIVEARTPLGVFRDIAAAAACIAVIAVGVYGFVKMKSADSFSPNDSGSSYSESSCAESGSSSKIRPDPENIINYYESIIAKKPDNEDYAVVYIEETNASEDMPIYITIYSFYNSVFEQDNDPVSETVKITGPGEYIVHYTRPWGAGTLNCLELNPTMNYEPILRGTWIP